MSSNHERLLGASHKLIEDFTCPVSGLPTPDRELSRLAYPIPPLTQCVRSIWGVSDNGNALKITQGYNVGNFKQVGDPSSISHRELRVDLYESEVPSPVSVLHFFESRDSRPQYQGFGVEAQEPNERWPDILKSTNDVQGISERALNTMVEGSLAWFVTVDARLGLDKVGSPFEITPIETPDIPDLSLASINGDTRILIAPYNFPEDITASIFAPDNKHRPTSPGPEASRESVRAMEATISEYATALHGLMRQVGALDISKV